MQGAREHERGFGESMVSNWIRNRDTGLLWAGCHWKAIQENFTLSRWLRPQRRFGRVSFYIYDLRLLPYAEVEVIDRETF